MSDNILFSTAYLKYKNYKTHAKSYSDVISSKGAVPPDEYVPKNNTPATQSSLNQNTSAVNQNVSTMNKTQDLQLQINHIQNQLTSLVTGM